MDSSDEDTFDESNATEDEEENDEIFEEDEIDDDGKDFWLHNLIGLKYRNLFFCENMWWTLRSGHINYDERNRSECLQRFYEIEL